MFTITVALWLLEGSLLPRVEDPWPHSIGLGFPFTMAGAWAILASVVFAEAPLVRRDRAISKGGIYGFYAGALLYVLALVVQVGSSL